MLSAGQKDEPPIAIDKSKCTGCGLCTEHCPPKALAFDSREMTTEEVMEELLRDRVFYEVSGGGITLTGGDPLSQLRFNLEVLRLCKREGLHTAIETSLLAEQENLRQFLQVTDLFIVDIKTLDSRLHKEFTGKGNGTIKGNFEMLARENADILVRVPMIPHYTGTEENVQEIGAYVSRIRNDIEIELLNYNPLAKDKYRLMRQPFPLPNDCAPFSEKEMEKFQKLGMCR